MRVHFHIYRKLESDNPYYNWGGIICRRRVWRCVWPGCTARRAKMNGSMPV